jgi:hypothetical protein
MFNFFKTHTQMAKKNYVAVKEKDFLAKSISDSVPFEREIQTGRAQSKKDIVCIPIHPFHFINNNDV